MVETGRMPLRVPTFPSPSPRKPCPVTLSNTACPCMRGHKRTHTQTPTPAPSSPWMSQIGSHLSLACGETNACHQSPMPRLLSSSLWRSISVSTSDARELSLIIINNNNISSSNNSSSKDNNNNNSNTSNTSNTNNSTLEFWHTSAQAERAIAVGMPSRAKLVFPLNVVVYIEGPQAARGVGGHAVA